MSNTPFTDSAIEAYEDYMRKVEEEKREQEKSENLHRISLLREFMRSVGHEIDSRDFVKPEYFLEGFLLFSVDPKDNAVRASYTCRDCLNTRKSKPLHNKVEIGEFLFQGCNCGE